MGNLWKFMCVADNKIFFIFKHKFPLITHEFIMN